MKTQKIKRYRLGVSRNFPITHPRKGEPTYFDTKIEMMLQGFSGLENTKVHTIRSNYQLWAKRIAEVQAGRAVIELFYWSGKPYHKDENGIGQVVFATLDKDSGCGVQTFEFPEDSEVIHTHRLGDITLEYVAKNDGLSLDDFKAWFKGYDLSQPMAIIHFTKFRY